MFGPSARFQPNRTLFDIYHVLIPIYLCHFRFNIRKNLDAESPTTIIITALKMSR